MDQITLNKEEAEAVYELIEELAGNGPENIFAGEDTLYHPLVSACAKIFSLAGKFVPDKLMKLLKTE